MAKYTKYTKELLEPLVEQSISLAEVIRKLGLREAGGTYSHLGRKIKEYQLDTSHFLGMRVNSGARHKRQNKLSWQEILIKRDNGRRQSAVMLRRSLIEYGREYKCVDCPNIGIWNDKPITLQIDHKNRDWLDDTPENLEFRCPNCHSQTPGWCGSKGGTEVMSCAKRSRDRRKEKIEQ